jgi:uncharacterized membrane protein
VVAVILDTQADIAADIERTWAALIDIRSWPDWMDSISSLQRLDDGPLRMGSRARIVQPGMPALIWEVSEIRPPEEFTWHTALPGVRIIGRHVLRRNPDGTVRVELSLEQRGPLAGLVNALTGARARRYLDMEAAGLKAASEAE